MEKCCRDCCLEHIQPISVPRCDKRDFVLQHVTKYPCRSHRNGKNLRPKEFFRVYNLVWRDGMLRKVCKQAFMKAVGISSEFIHNTLKQTVTREQLHESSKSELEDSYMSNTDRHHENNLPSVVCDFNEEIKQENYDLNLDSSRENSSSDDQNIKHPQDTDMVLYTLGSIQTAGQQTNIPATRQSSGYNSNDNVPAAESWPLTGHSVLLKEVTHILNKQDDDTQRGRGKGGKKRKLQKHEGNFTPLRKKQNKTEYQKREKVLTQLPNESVGMGIYSDCPSRGSPVCSTKSNFSINSDEVDIVKNYILEDKNRNSSRSSRHSNADSLEDQAIAANIGSVSATKAIAAVEYFNSLQTIDTREFEKLVQRRPASKPRRYSRQHPDEVSELPISDSDERLTGSISPTEHELEDSDTLSIVSEGCSEEGATPTLEQYEDQNSKLSYVSEDELRTSNFYYSPVVPHGPKNKFVATKGEDSKQDYNLYNETDLPDLSRLTIHDNTRRRNDTTSEKSHHIRSNHTRKRTKGHLMVMVQNNHTTDIRDERQPNRTSKESRILKHDHSPRRMFNPNVEINMYEEGKAVPKARGKFPSDYNGRIGWNNEDMLKFKEKARRGMEKDNECSSFYNKSIHKGTDYNTRRRNRLQKRHSNGYTDVSDENTERFPDNRQQVRGKHRYKHPSFMYNKEVIPSKNFNSYAENSFSKDENMVLQNTNGKYQDLNEHMGHRKLNNDKKKIENTMDDDEDHRRIRKQHVPNQSDRRSHDNNKNSKNKKIDLPDISRLKIDDVIPGVPRIDKTFSESTELVRPKPMRELVGEQNVKQHPKLSNVTISTLGEPNEQIGLRAENRASAFRKVTRKTKVAEDTICSTHGQTIAQVLNENRGPEDFSLYNQNEISHSKSNDTRNSLYQYRPFHADIPQITRNDTRRSLDSRNGSVFTHNYESIHKAGTMPRQKNKRDLLKTKARGYSSDPEDEAIGDAFIVKCTIPFQHATGVKERRDEFIGNISNHVTEDCNNTGFHGISEISNKQPPVYQPEDPTPPYTREEGAAAHNYHRQQGGQTAYEQSNTATTHKTDGQQESDIIHTRDSPVGDSMRGYECRVKVPDRTKVNIQDSEAQKQSNSVLDRLLCCFSSRHPNESSV